MSRAHIINCCLVISSIILSIIFSLKSKLKEEFDPFDKYGYLLTFTLYFLKYLFILALPSTFANVFGLILFDNFKGKIKLNVPSESLSKLPLICFRVVTRGDFPRIIKSNLIHNLNVCSKTGLINFVYEILTEKKIGIDTSFNIRETIVDRDYSTKNKTQFKARNLQFAIEYKGNDYLRDNDFIVHLDEETLITEDSLRGIINFIAENKYDFGHGVLTYAGKDVVNWWTTIHESLRVAFDFGCLQLQFRLFHKLIFGWKGTFIVARVRAEKDVGFDFGFEGSILEDNFFGFKAVSKGYTFDFINGSMLDKSTFTFNDFIKQRKRWAFGQRLVLASNQIPLRFKIIYLIQYLTAFYGITVLPNVLISSLYPLPTQPIILECLQSASFGFGVYSVFFGCFKQLYGKHNIYMGFLRTVILIVFPFTALMEGYAFIASLFIKKMKFKVVNKDNENHILIK